MIKKIGIGDKFHPDILQALEASYMGILLLSTDFFLADYIQRHELPYLLRRAEQGTLKLACLYVTAIPDDALQRTVDIDGQQRTVSLKDYVGTNRPSKPLESFRRRLLLDSRVVDWSRPSTPIFVIPSSLEPFFFNGFKNVLRFSNKVGG